MAGRSDWGYDKGTLARHQPVFLVVFWGLLLLIFLSVFSRPKPPSPQPDIAGIVWGFDRILLNGLPQRSRYEQYASSDRRFWPHFQIIPTTSDVVTSNYEMRGYDGCNAVSGLVQYTPSAGQLAGLGRWQQTLMECSIRIDTVREIRDADGKVVRTEVLAVGTSLPRDEVVTDLPFIVAFAQMRTYQLREGELWLFSVDRKLILVFVPTTFAPGFAQ